MKVQEMQSLVSLPLRIEFFRPVAEDVNLALSTRAMSDKGQVPSKPAPR